MVAAYQVMHNLPDSALKLAAGDMAFAAAGISGAVAVIVAGWTTANPTLYRAGLALQTITPNWSRWKVTLTAGLITTIIACFPFIFNKLLEYVAWYGLLLMPIGAVVFADFWLKKPIGLTPLAAEQYNLFINIPAVVTWIGTLVIVLLMPFHLFFKWLPGYFIAIVLYLILSWIHEKIIMKRVQII